MLSKMVFASGLVIAPLVLGILIIPEVTKAEPAKEGFSIKVVYDNRF